MNTKITASLIGMAVLVIVGISVLVARGMQNESSSDSKVNDDSPTEEQSESRNDFSDQREQTQRDLEQQTDDDPDTSGRDILYQQDQKQSVQETFKEIRSIQEQIASERKGEYEAGNQFVSVLGILTEYGICQQDESCTQNDARLGALEERIKKQDPSAQIVVDTGRDQKSYAAVLTYKQGSRVYCVDSQGSSVIRANPNDTLSLFGTTTGKPVAKRTERIVKCTNPTKDRINEFQQSNASFERKEKQANEERESELKALQNAILEFKDDHNGKYPGIPQLQSGENNNFYAIAKEGKTCDYQSEPYITGDRRYMLDGDINLGSKASPSQQLVPEYIAAIPQDPEAKSNGCTGYLIRITSIDKIVVAAPFTNHIGDRKVDIQL